MHGLGSASPTRVRAEPQPLRGLLPWGRTEDPEVVLVPCDRNLREDSSGKRGILADPARNLEPARPPTPTHETLLASVILRTGQAPECRAPHTSSEAHNAGG